MSVLASIRGEKKKPIHHQSLADKTGSTLHLATSEVVVLIHIYVDAQELGRWGNKSMHLDGWGRSRTRCPHSCSREWCNPQLLFARDKHIWSGRTHNTPDTWYSTRLPDSFHWSLYTLQKDKAMGAWEEIIHHWQKVHLWVKLQVTGHICSWSFSCFHAGGCRYDQSKEKRACWIYPILFS